MVKLHKSALHLLKVQLPRPKPLVRTIGCMFVCA